MMESSMPLQQSNTKRGFVKQVLSGDSVVLQFQVQPGSPPNEMTVYLFNVAAPKLAKHPTKNSEGTTDEPYAWEAREFIRKRLVGKTITFMWQLTSSGREYGNIYISGTGIEDAENISESGISAGLLKIHRLGLNHESTKNFLELQQQAKEDNIGIWSSDKSSKHVRNIQWNFNDSHSLLSIYGGKPIDAVIEEVHDGSTVSAFLLPSFYFVKIALNGIKTPALRVGKEGKPEEYAEEAKSFVEFRLLQRDVTVILERISNQKFDGNVLHPKMGNIAEWLLREGLAKCDDQTMSLVTDGGEAKLHEAEKIAKQQGLRIWKRPVLQPASTSSNKNSSVKIVDSSHGGAVYIGQLKCYNCGQFGHFARECGVAGSSRRPGVYTSGVRGNMVCCSNCYHYGHLSRDCHFPVLQPVEVKGSENIGDGTNIVETPQSWLNAAVFNLNDKRGALSSDCCWHSASLQLQYLLEYHYLEINSHQMRRIIVNFIVEKCVKGETSSKMIGYWTQLEACHSNSYMDDNALVFVKNWINSSCEFSNLIYKIHKERLFKRQNFFNWLWITYSKKFFVRRDGIWRQNVAAPKHL